jgi:hypothetical protein
MRNYFYISINKAVLCSGNNNIDHISEEVLSILMDKLSKRRLGSVLALWKDTFPAGFSSRAWCITTHFIKGSTVE